MVRVWCTFGSIWPVHDGMVGKMLMLLTYEHVQLSLNVAEFPGFHSSVYMLIAL